MRKSILTALIAMVVMMGFTVASASANVHQSHMGACARETENIKVGVSDLVANGVATKFAAHFGILAGDGTNVVKRLESKLVIGEAVKAVTMHDTGCDGHGDNFNWINRTVETGEHVVVKPPASVGSEACKHVYEKGCVTIIIKVETLLPISCWNRLFKLHLLAEVRISVRRKHHKKPTPKPAPKPVPASFICAVTGVPVASPTQCVSTVIEGPKTSGAGNCNSTNSGNLSGTGDTQGSCNVTNVTCNGEGSCSPKTENTCTAAASGGTASNTSSGGNATAEACKKEAPKEPPKEPQKPAPPSIVSMTTLNDVPVSLPGAEFTEPQFKATVELPGSDSGKITIVPEFGKMVPSDSPTTGVKTYEVGGGATTVTLTYKSPGEVPDGNPSTGVPPGYDRITVTVTDTVTGLKAERYTQFRIDPSPETVRPS